MKKADFVKDVSEKAGVSKKDAENVIAAALETIENVLLEDDSITFMGFGTFSTVERTERQTTLPGTKRKITVPASKSVKFKVGKNLKESIAQKSQK
jgi:DNA-binding protein HU-beta